MDGWMDGWMDGRKEEYLNRRCTNALESFLRRQSLEMAA